MELKQEHKTRVCFNNFSSDLWGYFKKMLNIPKNFLILLIYLICIYISINKLVYI